MEIVIDYGPTDIVIRAMRLGGRAKEEQLLRGAIQTAPSQARTEESHLRRRRLNAHRDLISTAAQARRKPGITWLNSPSSASTSNYSPLLRQPERPVQTPNHTMSYFLASML